MSLRGTTLRNRSDEYKARLVARFTEDVLPLLDSKVLVPVIHTELDLERAQEAHDLLEKNETVGKVLLKVKAEPKQTSS